MAHAVRKLSDRHPDLIPHPAAPTTRLGGSWDLGPSRFLIAVSFASSPPRCAFSMRCVGIREVS